MDFYVYFEPFIDLTLVIYTVTYRAKESKKKMKHPSLMTIFTGEYKDDKPKFSRSYVHMIRGTYFARKRVR